MICKSIETFFSNNSIKNPKILVALSGGADSVALLYSLLQLKKRGVVTDISAIHINHNLRDSAKHDELFCVNLCNKKGISISVVSVNLIDYAKENKLSIEEAGRVFRYDIFFKELATINYDYIATAHHKDDVIESFLINLFKGTGLKGASSISKIFREKVIRPLLEVDKNEIYNYLEDYSIEFVTDETNFQSIYYRNFIRNKIVPQIRELEPQFSSKISNFVNICGELDNYLAISQEITLEKDLFQLDYISRNQIGNCPKSLLHYKLFNQFQKWGLSEDRSQIWDNVHALLINRSTGEIPLKNNNFIILDSDGIRKKREFKQNELVIDKAFKEADFEALNNQFKITLKKDDKNSYFLKIDSKIDLSETYEMLESEFPYKLGFRFDGVKNVKGKKIKDIFVKKRIPMSYKDFWPLLFNKKSEVCKILFIKRWH